MTRLQQRVGALRSAGRKGLVPFMTAGDPSLETTVPVMHALVEAGADVIDCKGHVLAPGLVDCQVFTGEPGQEHRETLKTASYAAAAWGEPECNPLHPLLIDCDCAPDPCAPTPVRWSSMQPGCIVVPGEGDDSILTRVVQSPDAPASYDLTRAAPRARTHPANGFLQR